VRVLQFAFLVLLVAVAPALWAGPVSAAYIFPTLSSPLAASNPTPFNLTGTAGYQLNLNGSGVASTATKLVGPPNGTSYNITNPLTYRGRGGTINSGEGISSSQMANRINSEIAKLDDWGFVTDGVPDAALNVDFGNDAWVSFNIPVVAGQVFQNLMIAEDGGLDPFRLDYCAPGATCQTIFNGFSTSALNALTSSTGGFGVSDSGSKIDQTFLFLFNQPLTGGYFKIYETSNYGSNSLLEIDFIGGSVGSVGSTPEPSAWALFGTVGTILGIRAWRRRKQAPAQQD
jgi:hypothetical protein